LSKRRNKSIIEKRGTLWGKKSGSRRRVGGGAEEKRTHKGEESRGEGKRANKAETGDKKKDVTSRQTRSGADRRRSPTAEKDREEVNEKGTASS